MGARDFFKLHKFATNKISFVVVTSIATLLRSDLRAGAPRRLATQALSRAVHRQPDILSDVGRCTNGCP